jgi:protein-tyrosine kinase
MSIIEQAAKRLDELRRAGVEVPQVGPPSGKSGMAESPPAEGMQAGARPVPAPHPKPDQASGIAPEAVAPMQPGPRHAVRSRRVQLDLARIAAAGIVTPDAPRSRVADEFRVVKRPLISNATGKGAAPIRNGNLIMVTSALPGEGKSFTAINLAMSMAMELDHTVLLVDADVARPSLPSILGLPAAKGLLDVLLEDVADLSEVLLKTDIEKLSILSAGSQHARATELLASEAMNRLLDEMATRYADRIIIFDSPPLLVTTEARVLATHMGQIVMVVEAKRTTQNDVKQALAAIEACPVKLMMLNKGRGPGTGGYYGYHGHKTGSGYGYGYAQ